MGTILIFRNPVPQIILVYEDISKEVKVSSNAYNLLWQLQRFLLHASWHLYLHLSSCTCGQSQTQQNPMGSCCVKKQSSGFHTEVAEVVCIIFGPYFHKGTCPSVKSTIYLLQDTEDQKVKRAKISFLRGKPHLS